MLLGGVVGVVFVDVVILGGGVVGMNVVCMVIGFEVWMMIIDINIDCLYFLD